MKIKFFYHFMLITFEKGELFEGLSVRMKGGGKLGDCEYYAVLSTMEWFENHQTFPCDDFVKQKIKELIKKDNETSHCEVIFTEED